MTRNSGPGCTCSPFPLTGGNILDGGCPVHGDWAQREVEEQERDLVDELRARDEDLEDQWPTAT